MLNVLTFLSGEKIFDGDERQSVVGAGGASRRQARPEKN